LATARVTGYDLSLSDVGTGWLVATTDTIEELITAMTNLIFTRMTDEQRQLTLRASRLHGSPGTFASRGA
jgi:hypothetical protein